MAACQTPLIAATKKAFLSFVNISFLLRFCINWCFSSREYSGCGVGGRGSLFPFCLFSMTFQAAFLEAVYAGRGRMNEEKKKEREIEKPMCVVFPRGPLYCPVTFIFMNGRRRNITSSLASRVSCFDGNTPNSFLHINSLYQHLCGVWASRHYTVLIVVG